jgi:hypothetical protein
MVLWICHLFAGGSCFILSPTIALHPSIPQSRRALANEVICGSHQRLQLRSRMIVPVLWAAGSEGYSLESIIPVTPEMMSTHTNILGETIITCRDFSVHSEKTVDALGSYSLCKEMPTFKLPEIAFVGKSNVGKSSLLNALFVNRKVIAPTSKNPGRTRTIRPYKVSDKQGPILVMLDLRKYCMSTFLFNCCVDHLKYCDVIQLVTALPNFQQRCSRRPVSC